MKQKHIIVVEDEKDIMEVIEYNLQQEGYEVTTSMNGKSGIAMIRSKHPDLVLLDIMLPELDGLEICRILKSEPATKDIPIIMVTAKEDESDIVIGLGLGADDYVAKPFSPKELMARVKALLRRSDRKNRRIDSPSCIILGPIKIDTEQFLVQLSGKNLSLTKTEFRILYKLASQPGRVLSREQLLQGAVGDHVIVLDRNIDVHIRAIRKSLGDYKSLIETVRGIGYRFKINEN